MSKNAFNYVKRYLQTIFRFSRLIPVDTIQTKEERHISQYWIRKQPFTSEESFGRNAFPLVSLFPVVHLHITSASN